MTLLSQLQEGDSYKHFEISETDEFLTEEMKVKKPKKYSRSLQKVLKSKLHGRNSVENVNNWAVSLLRCSGAFNYWRKCKLQDIDWKTIKLFTICDGLHP